MAVEQTFAIIKPDAVKAGNCGNIINMIERAGFDILRLQKGQLSPDLAALFYDEHRERSFFKELVDFISSGPIVIMALQKENAVADWRKLMGVTNPQQAEQGTVRKLYASSIGQNAVHGSDSLESAQRELALFFAEPAPQQASK
ncbi:MAG: Nucleoside diphosphate kinase [uncultured bacterium]|nr:MAG: Nucleoside diphosphate kinase [uncultured bacterium]HLE76588.1 nucleoside-diphosphate kinase [Candidatus Babeliales bacterium]